MTKHIAKTNRVAEKLGITLPLMQAPMNYISAAPLVAAVSKAGAMGVLAPNAGKRKGELLSMEERTRREFKRIRAITDKPVGLNVVMPVSIEDKIGIEYANRTITVAKETKCNAIFCVGSLFPKLFERIKLAGMTLVVRPLTPTPKLAREAQAMGADILVATGFDEGGWLPNQAVGTFTVIPTIVDAVQIPVVAAGGITDIRGVRAAFALGAEGVYVGTRFIASEECSASLAAKNMILNGKAEDLLVVSKFQRSLPTSFAIEAHCAYLASPETESHHNVSEKLREGMYDGNLQEGIVSVNTGIDIIRSIKPAGDIVLELMADFI